MTMVYIGWEVYPKVSVQIHHENQPETKLEKESSDSNWNIQPDSAVRAPDSLPNLAANNVFCYLY